MHRSIVKTLLVSAPEFVFLLGLWMLYVSNTHASEAVVGIFAALIAAFADAVVKQRKLVSFFPNLRWISLIFWQPWYAIDGSWAIFVALFKRLIGKESDALFRAVKFDLGGDDDKSETRRALAVAYMTMPPNFVVLGFEREKGLLFVHQVSPTPTPLIAKKLGAKS
jgi:multisubunit Na+/H+ antiporter MnhE subunit